MSFERNLRKEERCQYELRDMYRSFGYQPYRMGKFEEYELYMRNRSFLRGDRILTFTDTDGSLKAMKPDVTLSIVKNYTGEHLQKLCYNESVFRPGDSGFRQILQSGLECIGRVDDYLQSEVVTLACRSLAMISDAYLLDVSHLGFISSMVDALVPEEARRRMMKAVGQKNAALIRTICEEEEVNENDREKIVAVTQRYGSADVMLPFMRETILNGDMQEAYGELERTVTAVQAAGAGERIRIDLSMIDDLHYYNGIIFRGMVEGLPETILSGGRYDNLLKRLGKNGRAIGFAIYLDLLERLDRERDPYDADILLLYEKDAKPEEIIRAVNALRTEGYSVRAQTEPDTLRCRRTAYLKEGAWRFND
ncbi:MAG: ATP phosphoribosyltransferase regulatory subunit [Clostridia bacterium]|nr:ATP phosphoribosyltransferase regulatory subunit [Clostridia bacterium]